MPLARLQVRIPANSGQAEDTVVNTWHIFADSLDEGTRSSVKTALTTFYNALTTYKSNQYAWTLARVRIYNLSEPEPRTPVEDTALGLTAAPATSQLPKELAICLSFKSDPVSGSNPGRRRGRIYLGALNQACLDGGGQVLAAAQTAIRNAGSTFLATSALASEWSWVVYSRTAGAGYDVTAGWVDNEFDVQRRRQQPATVRSTF